MLFEDFQGFKTIEELKKSNYYEIPENKGVYIILFKGKYPVFLEKSSAGRYKRKNPTVSIEKLSANWIKNEEIIYIGKAGKNIRKRIKQYVEFGSGKPVGHWGGRYIWQIKNPEELVVAWKETEKDPEIVESELINTFKEKHDNRPFANLIK